MQNNKKNKEISKTWCSHLWNHQFIGIGGKIKPCCRFKESDMPQNYFLNKERNNKDLFHSSFMQSVRKKMLNGETVEGCKRCYDEEKTKKRKSLRQIYNNDNHINQELDINKPEITYLELCFSNLCNLRCRMCNPNFSSNWNLDWSQLTGDKKKYKFNLNISHLDIKSISKKLRYIKMTGGEPFLIKEYEEILEKLVQSGNASNIHLNYSTNLTIEPSEKLIKLWEKFKYIEFAFSLDGINSVMEYIRFPTKWKKVENVTKKLLKLDKYLNINYGIRPTIMIYNILNLPKIMNWWEEQVNTYSSTTFNEKSWFNPTHLDTPKELAITVFPKDIKNKIEKELFSYNNFNEKIMKSFKHLCHYMKSSDNSHLFPQFKEYTRKLDSIRKESFSKSCPQIYNLLKNSGYMNE